MDYDVTFDLFEIDRDRPCRILGSVTAPRRNAQREIQRQAIEHAKDGPVEIRARDRLFSW